MIITEKNTCPVEKSSILSEKKFTIKASAKAFRALSSQIYSDPISAPIRELATNAWDAHRESNRLDKQFIVHLPNHLEKFFSIRDFGFGMSEDQINDIYTQYFNSTKADSNDYVGCLGLGSKSPFCYCDSFTVTSYWKSSVNSKTTKKYIYSAYLENGEPALAKLGEEETNDESGMEISFSVKDDDIQKFSESASNIYSNFKQKPKVVGSPDFKLKEFKYNMTGTGWSMIDINDSERYNKCSYAVMGNISYPLRDFSYKLMGAHRSLLDCSVEIQFEIGELEITLSREALQYDDRTVANIKKKMDIVLKEIEKIVSDKLKDCKFYWDACVLYRNLMGNNGYSYEFRNLIKHTSLTWNNKSLYSDFNIKSNASVGIVFGQIFKYFYGNGNRRNYSVKSVKRKLIQSIECVDKLEFYFLDSPKKYHSKIKHYIDLNPEKQIILLMDSDQIKLNEFIKITGIDSNKLKKVSSLPDSPVKKSNGKSNPKNVRVAYEFQFTSNYSNSSNWKHSLINLNDKTKTYYYIPLNNFFPSDSRISNLMLPDIIKFSNKHLGFDQPVFGVFSNRVDGFKKYNNCVNFFEYIEDKFLKFCDSEKNQDLFLNSLLFENLKTRYNYNVIQFFDHLGSNIDKLEDGILKQFIIGYSDFKKTPNQLKSKYGLEGNVLEFFAKLATKTLNIKDQVCISMTYPLLIASIQGKGYHIENDFYKNLIEYTNLVDKSQK